MSVRRGKADFTDLLMGSFLASVFVWIWMNALTLLDTKTSTLPIVIGLTVLQYIFFGAGGFMAAYIVSARTEGFDILVGPKVGLGAWIISSTLFIPQSGSIKFSTLILTLVSFITGGYFGAGFNQRRKNR